MLKRLKNKNYIKQPLNQLQTISFSRYFRLYSMSKGSYSFAINTKQSSYACGMPACTIAYVRLIK